MKFEFEVLPKEETIAGKCDENPEVYNGFGYIKVKPTNCILPARFKDHIDTIRNFEVRDTDIFLVSNPKCGTTWSMEMVWLLANNLDYKAAELDQFLRFPHIDLKGCMSDDYLKGFLKVEIMEHINSIKGQRFIKSHLPKDLLPTQIWTKKPKLVFVVRDPKDAAVSNYYHYKVFHYYRGTLDDFLKATLDEKVMYSPFWDQALEFWKMRDDPNVLFLRYEEMKADLPGQIKRTAKFLGKSYTNSQITELAEKLSFKAMKDNKSVNYEIVKEKLNKFVQPTEGSFIREGQTGGGKEGMSTSIAKQFDDQTRLKITGSGLEPFYLK